MATHIEHASYDAPEMSERIGSPLFDVLTPAIAAVLSLLLTIAIYTRMTS